MNPHSTGTTILVILFSITLCAVWCRLGYLWGRRTVHAEWRRATGRHLADGMAMYVDHDPNTPRPTAYFEGLRKQVEAYDKRCAPVKATEADQNWLRSSRQAGEYLGCPMPSSLTPKPTETSAAPRWYDGRPYYCADCGLGGGETSACEDGPCTRETTATAQARRDKWLAGGFDA